LAGFSIDLNGKLGPKKKGGKHEMADHYIICGVMLTVIVFCNGPILENEPSSLTLAQALGLDAGSRSARQIE